MANTINATALTPIVAGAITSDYQVTIYDQAGNAGRAAVADVVSAGQTVNGCVCVKTAEVFITSAQVLQLNTTPITIIPAIVGFGVELLSVSLEVIYGSAAYATNTTLIVGASGLFQQFEGDLLWVTSSQVLTLLPALGGGIQANTDIVVSVDTNNPATGNSDIRVRATYREVAL
jgi:hypothetical protein